MDDGVVEWEGEVPQGESINLMTKLTAASAVRQREANEAVGLSEQESTGGTVEQGGAGAGQCCGAGLPLWAAWVVRPRGLHSSIFRLNVSALCGIGGAFWACLEGVSGGVRGD